MFNSNPDKYSFKDLLATAFTVVFLWLVVTGDTNNTAQHLSYPITIILGGYFVHEVAGKAAEVYRKREDVGDA